MIDKTEIHSQCKQTSLAIHDALELLSGKWIPIIIMALLVRKNLGFAELKREISGISSKVLSDCLKRLEQQLVVRRKASINQNGKVEYSLSDHGKSLEKLLKELSIVGVAHRTILTGRNATEHTMAEFIQFGTKNDL
ncbi:MULTISPECIES: winged helix-turn-helix transcriptional regulator [unclassified Sphingobacterium]|uniref:winged helix-turn-helix transcriptional regulator n=1 Tax=unclassified Sphingobacterium TaxID=2609468 RepID=UPI0025CCE866|nr:MULTISPECIES: helix-turn-helix domain-containing protein [unclassified Sphingobacterium]